MKMWIIPVIVWVGLATSTLYAPKDWPVDKAENYCNKASWVSSAFNKEKCGTAAQFARGIEQFSKGMSPADQVEIQKTAQDIMNKPQWQEVKRINQNCPFNLKTFKFDNKAGVSTGELNKASASALDVAGELQKITSDCIRKTQATVNGNEMQEKQVGPFCIARTFAVLGHLQSDLNKTDEPSK